jgi:hypothetical protein
MDLYSVKRAAVEPIVDIIYNGVDFSTRRTRRQCLGAVYQMRQSGYLDRLAL